MLLEFVNRTLALQNCYENQKFLEVLQVHVTLDNFLLHQNNHCVHVLLVLEQSSEGKFA